MDLFATMSCCVVLWIIQNIQGLIELDSFHLFVLCTFQGTFCIIFGMQQWRPNGPPVGRTSIHCFGGPPEWARKMSVRYQNKLAEAPVVLQLCIRIPKNKKSRKHGSTCTRSVHTSYHDSRCWLAIIRIFQVILWPAFNANTFELVRVLWKCGCRP